MVSLQKIGVAELILALPRRADCFGNKTKGAASTLELRDVREPLSEQTDEFGVERVAEPQLVFEVRLEGAWLDGDSFISLLLQVLRIGAGDLCRPRLINRREQSPR